MSRIDAKIRKVFEYSNGGARTIIYVRNDGFYDFLIEEKRVVDGEGFPASPTYGYWMPINQSGLYETFEDAQDAAISETSWLKSFPTTAEQTAPLNTTVDQSRTMYEIIWLRDGEEVYRVATHATDEADAVVRAEAVLAYPAGDSFDDVDGCTVRVGRIIFETDGSIRTVFKD